MSSCHCNYSLQTKLIRHIRKHKGMYRLASCVAVSAVGPKLFGLPWYLALATGAALYLLTGGWKWVQLTWKTFGRDMNLARTFISIELGIRGWIKKNLVLSDIFEQKVKLHPNKIAFLSADSGMKLTFQEANNLSNKVANIFYEAGYRKGDIIALLMENCVEYVPIWLGLSKIGVTTSLINFNLRGNSLSHCINVCECKAVVYSHELEAPLKEIESELNVEFYCFAQDIGRLESAKSLQSLISSASEMQPPRPDSWTLVDKILYIYTSGTTGLPKAAVIRGTRFSFMSYGVGLAIGLTENDISYNSLPLYHSNGGIALAGQPIFFGNTLVLRKKFSASQFFEDCTKHNVTVINYIGETCRYLLAQPKHDFDKAHHIRVATGNGLRPSIWKEFQNRFNIPNIGEFYGATEGNANMINNVNRVGAVGYNSVLIPWVFPIKLVKVNKDTGDILRDFNGLALDAQPGEVGELVGKVRSDAMHQFDGYVNKMATQKKIAYDIFKKGDSAFMTGDMLMQDEEGFYYFQDRTGDTFRWKGENVSTNEVEGVISKSLELSDVCVYGVEVPGIEGKAGMACICDPHRQVDLVGLSEKLNNSLAPFARPVFIRLANEIAKTSTFKFQKNILRKEGFNPSDCSSQDHLYYYNGKEKKFLPIDAEVYRQIVAEKIRF